MRLFMQYYSFGLCLAIIAFSLISIKRSRWKLYSNLWWAAFGLVGVLFYIDVFTEPNFFGIHGTDLSAVRTVIQYTMVAVWLGLWCCRKK
jgi:hypothetical protein